MKLSIKQIMKIWDDLDEKEQDELITQVNFSGKLSAEDFYNSLVLNIIQDTKGSDSIGDIKRIANRFAVQNTWTMLNKSINLTESNSICDSYLGKTIRKVEPFLLQYMIWRLSFSDDSWILAADVGNGWYKPLTEFNDYKIKG